MSDFDATIKIPSIKIFVPGIVTKNRNNAREHWSVVAKRAKMHKGMVGLILASCRLPKPPLPIQVELTRCGGRKMDSDGLASALKDVRDAVAAWFKVDDGSELYTWTYSQEPGKVGVRIEIWSKGIQ